MRNLPFFWAALGASLVVHGAIFYFMLRTHQPGPNPIVAPTVTWTLSRSNPSRAGSTSVQKLNKKEPSSSAEHTGVATSTIPTTSDQSPNGGTSHLPADPGLAHRLAMIREKIESNLEFPASLQRKKIEGDVTLSLEIDPEGRLEAAEILQSSGNYELDQLALTAANRAAPYPRSDSNSQTNSPSRIRVPIRFKIVQ